MRQILKQGLLLIFLGVLILVASCGDTSWAVSNKTFEYTTSLFFDWHYSESFNGFDVEFAVKSNLASLNSKYGVKATDTASFKTLIEEKYNTTSVIDTTNYVNSKFIFGDTDQITFRNSNGDLYYFVNLANDSALNDSKIYKEEALTTALGKVKRDTYEMKYLYYEPFTKKESDTEYVANDNFAINYTGTTESESFVACNVYLVYTIVK